MFDIESLDMAELEQLRDACSRRLLQMRRTQGLALPDLLRLLEEVKATLRDQGKEWHSLERWQWMDGEIRFWLNPNDQDLYKTGWFSIDDLIAWAQDRGSILIEDDLDDEPDEALWKKTDSVAITWLPKALPNDSVADHHDVQLKLV